MTEKTFTQSLRRGLGGAIIEIRDAKDKVAYRDPLLRCCLRDIAYDWQCEGTKGRYLYDAIQATGEPEYYEGPIIERFLSRCGFGLFCQLAGILRGFAEDDSEAAKDALWSKYEAFAAKRGRFATDPWMDEGSQWDELASHLAAIDGFSAFKRYAADVGRLLLQDPDNEDLVASWFWDDAEELFGKRRVAAFIERARSPYVRALADAVRAKNRKDEDERQGAPERERVALEGFVRAVREAAAAGQPPELRTVGPAYSFAKDASEDEWADLARIALAEEDETVRSWLLRPFGTPPRLLIRPFPLDIAPFMEWAWSGNERLSWAAVDCLAKFKDARVHDLALRLLEERGLGSRALALLLENYRRSDDAVIARLMKRASSVPHNAQMEIKHIYRRHRSRGAGPILLAAYRKGPCALCRYGIVRAMRHCGVLTDDILGECLYDSYPDTRAFAGRVLRGRARRGA